MSVTSVLARLTPVSLEDIVEQAELLIRVDRKYLMARADAEMLVATVPANSQVLEIAGQRQFGYRSLYFDTARLDAYRGTAQRRRRRFKVRTRRYDTGAEFLEVKTRQASATVKHRIPSPASGLDLGVAGTVYVERQLAAAGVELTTALVATLWTSYTRSTLLLPADSARITIDTGLCWSSPHHDDRLLVGEVAIVETKSAGQASSADRLLWSLGHRPVSISKYGTGLAALHPGLPSNRWHRLLGNLAVPR